MKKRLILSSMLVLFGAFAPPPLLFAQGQAAPSSQVTFVSGGVGADSAAQMAAVGKEFNLKLLFAAKDGHYLADVAVTISDARGSKVLDTVSEGPFLFARLAPGKYQVTATYSGAAQTRGTIIAAAGRRELTFRWDERSE